MALFVAGTILCAAARVFSFISIIIRIKVPFRLILIVAIVTSGTWRIAYGRQVL